MAMMAKMRSLAPAFIVTVGALFVLFMIISDSNVLEAIGGRTNVVGSVNGMEISYQEYQQAIEQQRETTKQQTGQDIPDEQLQQFRDQVWDAVVTQKLLEKEIEKLGVTVSNEEIRDAILGDNPPPFLKQNFIDSNGTFNRALYEEAIFNPQNEQVLLQAEDWVRQTRLNEKLQSLLLASITVNEDEIKRKFIEQNIFITAQYALFANSLFPDSLLNLTEDDYRKFYEDNLDRFKMNAQRKVNFVMFRNQPSAADTNLVIKNLENVKEILFNDTADFKSFVDIYSDQPYAVDTVDASELSAEALEEFQKAKGSAIIGPVASPQGYVIYNLIKEIPSNDVVVRASHILIKEKPTPEENLVIANQVYQDLINGADFETVAKEKSGDPGSAVNGGDLGWFARGRMIKEFEDACFNGKVGEIQKPVKTTFGYHIIKVTGRSDKKYIVEKIINQVKQSAATLDETYNKASDFAYLANKNGFESEAKLMNYEIRESQPFAETSASIPGLGANSMLIKWAFDNSLGDVSDVFRVQGGFIVTKISDVKPEGYRPYEEVKAGVMQLTKTEKKYEQSKILAEELMERVGGDISKIPALDPRIPVKSTGRFNAQSNLPDIGKDWGFINAALEMDKGETSGPVKGLKGHYIIHILDKSPFDSSAYKIQSATIRNNILQEKRNAYLTQYLARIKAEADIVDNRQLFYRY